MEPARFDQVKVAALRIARVVAGAGLPIEEALAHVEELLTEEATVAGQEELLALQMVLQAVGELAGIGALLPAAAPAATKRADDSKLAIPAGIDG